MSKVFFIADTHFGHRAICKYRPQFKTPDEHDEMIISNWNKVVTKKKFIVWVLGDFCIHNNKYDMDKIIKRLNGTIKLITGNHCHLPYYKNIEVMNGLTSRYGFWLSHYPIHPIELRGKKNIHGHVHNNILNDNNYISVCCESINFTPKELEEIRLLPEKEK